MKLTIAVVNLKPGTGKTTTAVWLAHAFAAAGLPVLLADADPAASALEWSDLVADRGYRFPFRITGLAVRTVHQKLAGLARPDEIVIVDCPQLEDSAAIARSAIRAADEVLIPCAPTPIELNRTAPIRTELDDIEPLRGRPVRSCVLLNRTIVHANSTKDTRDGLAGIGYDVLGPEVPRLEVYAQSFGGPLPGEGLGVWRDVASALLGRAGL